MPDTDYDAIARAIVRDAHRSLLVGLGAQDPQAVHAWSKSLVRAFYAHGEYFCARCRDVAGGGAIQLSMEPETVCAHCGRTVGEGA